MSKKNQKEEGIEFPEDFNQPTNVTTEVKSEAVVEEKVQPEPIIETKAVVQEKSKGIRNWQDALIALPEKFGQLKVDAKRATIELGFASMIIKNNGYLKQANPQTIFDSIIYSARIGITLNPAFGFAYLVPRKLNGEVKCCLDIGYKGWCAILKSYGSVKHIDAHVVYEDEEFNFHPADGLLHHKPTFAKSEADQKARVVKCAYAVAILPDGEKVYEVIPTWELTKIKNVSSASKGFSPYTEWESEMIRKAPIKRLAKKLLTLQDEDRVSAMFEAEAATYQDNNSKSITEVFN
jgi:recombination protein RecT